MTTKIDFLKSCKGQIIKDGYYYKPTEFLKYFEYIKNQKQEYENIYIKKLLQSLQPSHAYTYDNIFDPSIIVLCCDTKLFNIVEVRENNEPYQKTKVCEISKQNEYYKLRGKPMWVQTINSEIILFTSLLEESLFRLFNDFFYVNNVSEYHKDSPEHKYKIVPNLISNYDIFDINKLRQWLIIKDLSDDNIYEFLSTINFLYIIDDDLKRKQSIFNFTIADIPLLEQIIININNFVKILFPGINENNIIIRIVPDKRYHYISIDFIIFNKFNQSIYSSYIELYKSINIKDLIFNLINGTNNIYYTIINEPVSEIFNCKIEYNSRKTIYPKVSVPMEQIQYFDVIIANIDELKIITISYPLNKYHSYCSLSILVEIPKQAVSDFYNISIKSITFEELIKNNDFKEKYLSELLTLEYKSQNKLKYANGLLSAKVEIIIKKVDNPMITYTLSTIEPADYYYGTVLTNIKDKVLIDMNLLLLLLWYKEYIRISKEHPGNKLFFFNIMIKSSDMKNKNFYELTELLLDIPVISLHIFGIINSTYYGNFIIGSYLNKVYLEIIYFYYFIKFNSIKITKDAFRKEIIRIIIKNNNISMDNKKFNNMIDVLFADEQSNEIIVESKFYEFIISFIDSTTENYITWYIPSDLTLDYDKLFVYIKTIDKKLLYTNMPDNLVNFLGLANRDIDFTNFYHLFQSGNFMYNIRSVNRDVVRQIKILLDTHERNYNISLISYFHYPNEDKLNVLHLQSYNKKKQNDDKTANYFDITFGRYYLFDKYKNISDEYFNKKDMTVYFRIKENYGLTKEQLLENKSFLSEKYKYHITRPELLQKFE